MKYLIFTLLIILLPLCASSDNLLKIERVEQLLWKNRIVLVWSDEQIGTGHIMEASKYDIDDRDIVWFVVSEQKVISNYKGVIANNFVAHTNNKYFKLGRKVVLIGKDGGVKHVDTALQLNTLFNKIDSMPMRINEMKSSVL